MNAFLAFLSPLALLLPAVTGDWPAVGRELSVQATAEPGDTPRGFDALPAEPFEALKQARGPLELGQVRIEQRMIIRISPGTGVAREQMLAELRRRGSETRTYHEEKLDGCIAVANIAGMEPAPAQNRLLLFMRDRRVLSAALERACNARDYYSGFYVERNEDGQLCANRELLQSRAGASCKVAQLSRLVAEPD